MTTRPRFTKPAKGNNVINISISLLATSALCWSLEVSDIVGTYHVEPSSSVHAMRQTPSIQKMIASNDPAAIAAADAMLVLLIGIASAAGSMSIEATQMVNNVQELTGKGANQKTITPFLSTQSIGDQALLVECVTGTGNVVYRFQRSLNRQLTMTTYQQDGSVGAVMVFSPGAKPTKDEELRFEALLKTMNVKK